MIAQSGFIGYCEIMLKNIKIYTSDKYWNQIFADLGADIAETPNVADIVFDDVDIKTPISAIDLKNVIFDSVNSVDIIKRIFGHNVVLPMLQYKIVVLLYKNPNITMSDLKSALGISPDMTSHVVENAIYQLRKVYGRDIIQNVDGKYKIGCV